ncbi:hypothetical protein JOC59_001538 [Weissella beninensis]|uniref:Antitoxin epsilon n=1 Tax=Periweissella beninensis TaxID=504936 RepID=A0ABT0VH81_9LACO|nr:antitoxin epsilon [Periweissella beninensis]MBM7544807.1 hypothetical protein [Periweissella beninensis]MCM2437189.1 antitoxin epsilon [Periweissella beninensis]
MKLDYEKTFEIEIINEFSASIYAKMLNYVLNNELDKNDLKDLQTNLLKQLSSMNQIDLFKLSLEESRQEETRFTRLKIKKQNRNKNEKKRCENTFTSLL